MEIARRIRISSMLVSNRPSLCSGISRRSVMLALPCLLLAGMLPSDVQANEKAAARTVSQMLTDLVELYRQTREEDDIADGLETIFKEYTDPAYISRAVIGVPWRRASNEQRTEFTSVFTRYLAEKYARYLPKSLRGHFDIVKVVELKENHFSVQSHVALEGSSPYSLRWYVIRGRQGPRVVNLVTDDFNLVNLERKVIRSLLNQRRGDFDRLIAYLPTRHVGR